MKDLVHLDEGNFDSVLTRQFNHTWNLLGQLITNCGKDLWFQEFSSADKGYWIYSLTIYHILETTDFYYRSSPTGMNWGAKGNIEWEEKKSVVEKISSLTKEFLSDYLEEIRQKTASLFFDQTVHLFEADGFQWFPTRVDKYLYLLRHNLMHIGELNKALRDSNFPRLKWE
jgi:hypothetical protein